MRRSALVALGLGVLTALAVGEGLVRLAARISPTVRDFARPRDPGSPPAFPSLDAYLASRPTQVVPHRSWYNHWNNALGLNDEEFTVPKPAGRFRIMAVGDSFTYGLVPYPHSVMTLLEAQLRTACRGRDLDVLNFGIGGSRIRDYRTLVTLGAGTYDPDLVLIHFYAGNDGPDLYRYAHESSWHQDLLGHSRLWTLGRNVVRFRSGVHAEPISRATAGPTPPPGPTPRGGALIDPNHRTSEQDPALAGPTYTEAIFTGVLAEELRRLYVPGDPTIVTRAWGPVFAELDAIRVEIARQGRRLALVVYPSALQVHAALRDDLVQRLRQRTRYAALSPEAIDPRLPGAQLAGYCRRAGLPCFDLTPDFVEASRAAPEALYKLRDTHWTIRGNHVAATAEARRLAGLVCPAEVTGAPRGPGPAGSRSGGTAPRAAP